MAIDYQDVINEFIERLTKHKLLDKIQTVYLFGSRARGDAEPRSDIDLSIDAPELKQNDWLLIDDIIDELHTLLEIQVINMQTASSTLKNNIQQQGVIIYEQREN